VVAPEIGKLVRLEELNLENNQLESFPKEAGECRTWCVRQEGVRARPAPEPGNTVVHAYPNPSTTGAAAVCPHTQIGCVPVAFRLTMTKARAGSLIRLTALNLDGNPLSKAADADGPPLCELWAQLSKAPSHSTADGTGMHSGNLRVARTHYVLQHLRALLPTDERDAVELSIAKLHRR